MPLITSGLWEVQTDAIPWANVGAPTVAGQIKMLSDVGPAPGIEIIANGTRWRPRGGSQVLAQRSTNPITVQNLAMTLAETIGPFPGGLVRAGMRLEMTAEFGHSGIGTGTRVSQAMIGSSIWWHMQAATSGASLVGNRYAALPVLSDTSDLHPRWASNTASYTVGAIASTCSVDFSAPWSVSIWLQSCAETAVAITGATWSGGVATFTATAHTLATGDKTVIAGVTPSGYNVAAGAIVTVLTANTFTIPIASDPGAYTSGGTSSRISNMRTDSYVLTLIG